MKRFLISLTLAAVATACFSPSSQYARIDADPLTAARGESRRTDNVVIVTDASNTQVQAGSYGQAKALAADFAEGALNDVSFSFPDLNADMHASADYRAHLIGVMARRAVAAAQEPRAP